MKAGDRIILIETADESVMPTNQVYLVKWADEQCVCFTTADSRTGITSRKSVAPAPRFHSLCGTVFTETAQ